MKPLPYKRRDIPLDAVQVTKDNLEAVAAWCGGSVRGTKLPKSEQVIEWYNPLFPDHPTIASVGDWIVRDENGAHWFNSMMFVSYFEPVRAKEEHENGCLCRECLL